MPEAKRRRWPSPPPMGARCDAASGVSHDFTGAPVIVRCPNIATEACRTVTLDHETWLCDSCRDHLVSDGTVYRNPRRYPRA